MNKQWRREVVGYGELDDGTFEARLTDGQVVPCATEEEAEAVVLGCLEATRTFRWMAEACATQPGVPNA